MNTAFAARVGRVLNIFAFLDRLLACGSVLNQRQRPSLKGAALIGRTGAHGVGGEKTK